jgi:hypothetical protein
VRFKGSAEKIESRGRIGPKGLVRSPRDREGRGIDHPFQDPQVPEREPQWWAAGRRAGGYSAIGGFIECQSVTDW